MRTKISHKLFTINIGIIVVLTSVCIYFFSQQSQSMFSGALNGIDAEVMKNLSVTLSQHYKENRSWDKYVSNKISWDETVTHSFFSTFFALMEKAKARLKQSDDFGMAPPNMSAPPGGAWDFPFGSFLQRVSLLDKDKKYVITAEILKEDVSYQPIKLDGKLIGWLSVGKINVDILPLGEYFFKQQVTIIYWVLMLGGFIACLVSFILSRHIMQPITKLIQGAKEIASRNYQHRLTVKSNDELQMLAESFNFVAKELDRFETQRKQWLLDISHELRTPLSIVISETSAICDQLTKCDISAVQAIQLDLQQIKRLVDDLHELSKIDELGLSFDKEKVNLQDLLNQQLTHYEKKFDARNIKLNRDFSAQSMFVFGDRGRLIQVVQILFENCCRYTASPGELWIRCHKQSGGVVLVIEDSGPGVPEESLNRLFDRLYRTDASRNRATGGAGLGLSICKEILTAHNAEISASRSSQGGLCLTVMFEEQEGIEDK